MGTNDYFQVTNSQLPDTDAGGNVDDEGDELPSSRTGHGLQCKGEA